MRPAYLVTGTDGAKIDAARAGSAPAPRPRAERPRSRCSRPAEGRGAPDADALLASIPLMSLSTSRRYLLVDGAERWRDAQQAQIAEAVASLPPDLTRRPHRPRQAAGEAGRGGRRRPGERCSRYDAPRARELPRFLAAEAKRRGFRLDPARGADARRPHGRRARCGWATSSTGSRSGRAREARSARADLEAMIADTSETAAWALADAVLERDPERALQIAERLLVQGENVTGLIYMIAGRLRKAYAALEQLERGVAAKEVESRAGDAPLRRQAARRPPRATARSRTFATRSRRWPTSRSGAAAAPTTATSSPSPSLCARAAGA